MPKKTATENTKKATGNAKKAEAAAQKAVQEDAKKAAAESEQWSKGAKSNARKEDAEAKRQAQLLKKAEKDALLAAEEATQRSTPKGATAKSASKKTSAAPARPLDLSQLGDDDDDDDAPSSSKAALNATGIDSALDALDLTSGAAVGVDRHPERRFKAAYAAFEARRLPELEQEMKGLRRQQRIEVVRKEFEKSAENPFNQVTVGYDATREEVRERREGEKGKVEGRLGGS